MVHAWPVLVHGEIAPVLYARGDGESLVTKVPIHRVLKVEFLVQLFRPPL